jgi:hypothetical protein
MLKKEAAPPSVNDVKIERLSKEEKRAMVEQAFKDAELENYTLTNLEYRQQQD